MERSGNSSTECWIFSGLIVNAMLHEYSPQLALLRLCEEITLNWKHGTTFPDCSLPQPFVELKVVPVPIFEIVCLLRPST